MKQNQWDDIIRNKMQSFRVEQSPKDWAAFEEKLSLSQGEPAQHPDESFDQLVFEKLKQFKAHAGQKEQHWQLFEKQLYYLSRLRQRLLQYKFIELFALTLLLLYVIEADAPGRQPLSTPVASLPTESIESTQTKLPTTSVADIPSTTIGIQVQEIEQNQVRMDAVPPSRNSLSIDPLSISTGPAQSLSVSTPALRLSPPTITLDKDGSVLQLLSPVSGTLAYPSPGLTLSLPSEPKYNIHISMLGGADYNRVMTPENLRAGIKAFERYSKGYRGGLLADVGRPDGRLHLGSGFIYTAKKYEVGYKRINGSFLRRGGITSESLSDIELNVLNVPVFARLDVWRGNRWSLFAQGGLALQMTLQTHYYAAYPENFPEPFGVNRTPSRYSPLKDRNGGLLEGGNFKENGFFSSQVGLGAERHMADRWSMFFQSRYEHSLGYLSAGLGPTEDRINTFSLETGIRIRLK